MSIFQEFLNEAKHLLKEATIEANTNDSAPDSQTDTLPESPNAVTPVKEPETKNKKSKKNKVKIVPQEVEETKVDEENGDNNRDDENMVLTSDDVSTGSPDIKNASNIKDAYVLNTLNTLSQLAPKPKSYNPPYYLILAAEARRKKEEEEKEEKEKELQNSNAVKSAKNADIIDSITKSLGKKVSHIDPNTQYYTSLGWVNNPGLSNPFGSKLASELLNNEYFLAGLLDALDK